MDEENVKIIDSESIFILSSGILYIDIWVSSSSINGDIFSNTLKIISISVLLFISEL
jgi:hypothetical protein